LIAIIQARTSSKRFPNKILHKLLGKPIIKHVIDRVKESKHIKKIIIATSKNKSDDKLASYLPKIECECHRGSLNNVALRMYETAKKNKAKYFMRISGDSPLIDPMIIDYAIKAFIKHNDADLITNIFPRNYPSGQSVEIIKTKILIDNLVNFNLNEKEHVTSYFYSNNKKFKIINFKKNINNYKNSPKLSIDYKSDLKKIIKYLND